MSISRFCGSCSDGMVFDETLAQFVPCPACSELRSHQVSDGIVVDDRPVPLPTLLGFSTPYVGLSLDPELLFGRTALEGYRTSHGERIDRLVEALGNLLDAVPERGRLKSSFAIYLGSRADSDYLAYLFLGIAHKAGLSAVPLLTPSRLRSRRSRDDEWLEVLQADLVVVSFSAGIRPDGYLVEDVLRERGLLGKPTIVLLRDASGLNGFIARMCAQDGLSFTHPLYIGVPRLSADESWLETNVNAVLERSNRSLGLGMEPFVVDQPQPSSSGIDFVSSRPSVFS